MKDLVKLLSFATFLTFSQTEIKAQPVEEAEKDSISCPLFPTPLVINNLNYSREVARINPLDTNKICIKDNQKKIILDSEDTNTLFLLTDYLNKKGFKIDSLLKDPRFEIYNEISNNFKEAPEIKMNSLDDYKKIIAYERKKEKIIKFIEDNLEKLLEAEKTYGIKREIIASVIGIESDFGEIIGGYNPFNVYVSLYLKDYKREFAKTQLEELLIFCEKNKLDILELKSSYAGAVSYAQFLPSSLNSWFIGEELYNMDNNILSVANYLSYFKKKTGILKNAVYRYNPSKLYVQAVIDLAHGAENEFKELNVK